MIPLTKVKIKELGKVYTGSTPSTKDETMWGDEYLFVKPSDMIAGSRRVFNTEKKLTSIASKTSKGRLLPAGTTCIVCIGTIGKLCQLHKPAATNQQLNSIVVDKLKYDPDYIYYLMSQSIPYVKVVEGGSASGREHVKKSTFEEIELDILPFDEQKKVGKLIVNYDNLIENNNRRIAILENMSQILYRKWFVKFSFPGFENCQLKDSQLGQIPEGWEVKPVEECYKTSSGGTPSRKKPEYYGDEHWWTKTKELKDGFITSVDEKISELGLAKSSAKLFPKDTVLLAMYGATIGRLGILTHESATNQACCALLPLNEMYSPWFIYLTLLAKRPDLLALGQGAAQQNISQQVIKGFKILSPERNTLKIFNETVEPMFREIELLLKSSNNLKQQRDMLLPKLTSGKINLKD